jgi:hypothetical protein
VISAQNISLNCSLLDTFSGFVPHLFDTRYGDVAVQLPVLARLLQIVVHLTGAEQHLLHVLRILTGGALVGDDPPELGVLQHVVEAALGFRMTQQTLGSHHDERLPERQGDLSPHDVEEVGRGGAVGDDPVDVVELAHGKLVALWWEVLWVVGGHLQEALQAGAGVLGTHALEAVREEHDEAALAHPLGLTRRDELVDDALGGVVEVAELGLPDDERVGVGHRVAELEAEHAELGEGAVADDVGRLVGVQVAQGSGYEK